MNAVGDMPVVLFAYIIYVQQEEGGRYHTALWNSLSILLMCEVFFFYKSTCYSPLLFVKYLTPDPLSTKCESIEEIKGDCTDFHFLLECVLYGLCEAS